MQSHDHRVIQVWRYIRRSLVQPHLLLKTGAAQRSDQVVQRFFHLGLKNLQEQRLPNFCGQPVPLSNCSPYNQFLLTCSLFQFVPVASHPPTTHHCEEPGSCWPILSACLAPSERQPCPSSCWLILPVWCHLRAWWRCILSLLPYHWWQH